MNFIIDLFKKAKKGDSLRTTATPSKYNDKIAQLNSLGSNQYTKLTTEVINKISKSDSNPSATKK
jgi:hypothetical protein